MAHFNDEPTGESVFLQFPDLDGAGYLVSLWQEAGLAMSNGMGTVPLTWQEIDSWLRVTEMRLSVWEKLIIKELSATYANELARSTDKHCVQPYQPVVDVEKIDRAAVASKLLNVLRGFKKKKPETEANVETE